MALSSFIAKPGAPDDGMALFGIPLVYLGVMGWPAPPGRLPSWGGLMGWP